MLDKKGKGGGGSLSGRAPVLSTDSVAVLYLHGLYLLIGLSSDGPSLCILLLFPFCVLCRRSGYFPIAWKHFNRSQLFQVLSERA